MDVTFAVQLLVTEIYPITDDVVQRDAWVKQYKDYLALKESDKNEIRELIEDWRVARSAGKISQPQVTTTSTPPKTLSREEVLVEWERQPIGNIQWAYSHISFEGNTARAYVYGLTII